MCKRCMITEVNMSKTDWLTTETSLYKMTCLQMGGGVGGGGVIRDTRWLASRWGGGGGVIRDTRWLASKWGGGGGWGGSH